MATRIGKGYTVAERWIARLERGEFVFVKATDEDTAEAAAELAGDALVHRDPRSDNICCHGRRTLLVDWNGAARVNPRFDLLAWLPVCMPRAAAALELGA